MDGSGDGEVVSQKFDVLRLSRVLWLSSTCTSIVHTIVLYQARVERRWRLPYVCIIIILNADLLVHESLLNSQGFDNYFVELK